MAHYHPEDRPDPSEQPIRARVPDHVAAGAFSTGVIVMTAQTEFILDFVQNLGRPHQIISRVVMPHHVLPQLVDALQRNIELYRNRWGELPQTGTTKAPSQDAERPSPSALGETTPQSPQGPASSQAPAQHLAAGAVRPPGETNSGGSSGGGGGGPSHSAPESSHSSGEGAGAESAGGAKQSNSGSFGSSSTRQASVQDIYDDLKIRDEILSGAYANAVMIGHGPHEFSFDFITNFYPHSAVSARVFLAAGQIPRLFESLKGTWEQMRTRMQQPPPGKEPPPNPPSSFSDEDNPFA